MAFVGSLRGGGLVGGLAACGAGGGFFAGGEPVELDPDGVGAVLSVVFGGGGGLGAFFGGGRTTPRSEARTASSPISSYRM